MVPAPYISMPVPVIDADPKLRSMFDRSAGKSGYNNGPRFTKHIGKGLRAP
jgi:hypothetical protein